MGTPAKCSGERGGRGRGCDFKWLRRGGRTSEKVTTQPRLEGSRGKSVPGAPQEEQGGRCGRSESGEQGRQSQEGSRQGPEHVRPYALP